MIGIILLFVSCYVFFVAAPIHDFYTDGFDDLGHNNLRPTWWRLVILRRTKVRVKHKYDRYYVQAQFAGITVWSKVATFLYEQEAVRFAETIITNAENLMKTPKPNIIAVFRAEKE